MLIRMFRYDECGIFVFLLTITSPNVVTVVRYIVFLHKVNIMVSIIRYIRVL